MNLKTKALIYRYTELFLAQKEQDEYINLPETQKYIVKLMSYKDLESDLTLEDATDLTIGMWQADEGFYRPISWLRYRQPAIFFVPLAWFIVLYEVLKRDISYCLKKNLL